jgi:hypothetical protein
MRRVLLDHFKVTVEFEISALMMTRKTSRS